MSGLVKGLLKWFICCTAICGLYCLLGNVGILFAIGFDYVIIQYM